MQMCKVQNEHLKISLIFRCNGSLTSHKHTHNSLILIAGVGYFWFFFSFEAGLVL